MALVVLLLVAVGGLLIAGAIQGRWLGLRSVARNLLITYTVVVLLLGAGEAYFRFVYADSRMEFALTRDNWANRYIQRNTMGYRDQEWDLETLAARKTIFAVGDSFTEGWGINDPADRFTDVLAMLLGDEYAVVNLGISGRSTIHQLEAAATHPHQPPDVLLWQYFLNDIDVAAKSNGMDWTVEVPPIPAIAEESYLASFLFWRLNEASLYVNVTDGLSEWDYLYAAYDNAPIWEIHQGEIDRMLEYVEETGTRLIVVIFPNMRDPVRSVGYVDRVAQYLESKGQSEILTLYDAAAAWALENRIVSNVDSHASAAFSRYVGQVLYDTFFAAQP